jgi:uncharacterized protein YdaT
LTPINASRRARGYHRGNAHHPHAGTEECQSMPWTLERYPPAMRRLPPTVRAKAIEIANAMLAEGCAEGQAIRMAIAAARRWAEGIRDREWAARGNADSTPWRRRAARRAAADLPG